MSEQASNYVFQTRRSANGQETTSNCIPVYMFLFLLLETMDINTKLLFSIEKLQMI